MLAGILAGSVVSGAMGMMSANKTAKAAENAAQMQTGELARQYDQTRQDQMPWLASGRNALSTLNAEMGLPSFDDQINKPLPFDQWAANQSTASPLGLNEWINKYKGGLGESESASDYLNEYNQYKTNLPRPSLGEYEKYVQGFTPQSQVTGAPRKDVPMYGEFQSEHKVAPDFQFKMEEDPGYRFALEEARKQAIRQSAAQGGRNSGNVLAELNDRAVGLASTYANDVYNRQLGVHNTNANLANQRYQRDLSEYGLGVERNRDMYGRTQDRLNRLSSMAGLGQTTANTLGTLGSNTAANIGNAIGNASQIKAGAYTQGANAMNNAVQGGLSNYMTWQHLQNQNNANNSYWSKPPQ